MADDEQKIIFSRNLLKYLSLSEKTQKEVADAISVSPQTFNTWCQGIALPRMGKVQALSDYFKIKKSDLLDEKSSTDPEPTYTLTPKEEVLVSDFRTLNDQGQDYILQTMDMVKDKYKKSADVSGMEKIG